MKPINITTRQKSLLKVFEKEKRPLTAQAAWMSAGRARMSLATVYRAIGRLTEAGLLRSIEITNAPPMYEAVLTGHHHHFYCTECGKVYEIKKCVSTLGTLIPKGFRMKDHTITLYGECAKCVA
ncbi:Fur family transcriptional regulator [soil metagenome]